MQPTPRNLVTRDTYIHEPTISCPHCHQDIKLTESLAAPLLKSRELEFSRKESELREREVLLQRDRDAIEEAINDRLNVERKKVAEEEQRKARLALGIELETKQRELNDLTELFEARNAKLAEAHQEHANVIRKQRELADKERELEVTIEQRVSANTSMILKKAKQDAEDQLRLKLIEKDQLIQSMRKQVEEMQRKAEQGSQQAQGDVMELELESLLRGRFDSDTISRVQKGEFGGDVMQRVASPTGLNCGTILWESKRTRNWSDGWLTKLRGDQRRAKVDIAVIVSHALPENVTTFALIDGVYVVSPECALPVATVLRERLIKVGCTRRAAEGKETSAGRIYEYLTGSAFRQRLQGIVEAFTSMQEDLAAEKRAIHKQWAKREAHLDRMMISTVGMYGDLQGIAGKGLQEIEGLELHENADIPLLTEKSGTTKLQPSAPSQTS